MKYIFLYISIAFLVSCNSSTRKEANNNQYEEFIFYDVNIKPVKLDAGQLPSAINVKGQVQEAWKWNDKLGENILLTTQVAPYKDLRPEEEDDHSAELYAFHYIKKGEEYRLLWQMSDTVKGCPFDITCQFINGATTITDLDSNGVAETKLQYSLACRSDVSPAYMKLVMHQDTVKYALRGAMWVRGGPGDKFAVTENDADLEKLPRKKDEYEQVLQSFGRYENEKDFSGAAPSFLSFARKEWLKYVKEKMGEEE